MRLKLFFLLFLPLIAGAEELNSLSVNPELTLASVVEKTFERNPQQQVLRAGSQVVEAKNIHASSLLPAAPAISVRHQNDKIGSGRNQREWEAGLEIPVWLPGQRSARVAVATDAQTELSASRAGLKLILAGQVRDALWDIAMQTGYVDLAQSRFNAAEALQRDVQKRYKAGELAKTDFMLAQNETLQAQTLLLRASAELKHAEHRYWMLTGLKELPAKQDEPLSGKAELDDNHPLLIEAASRVGLAQVERNLVQVEKRENPQVTVGGRYEQGAFDTAYNASVGVALRVPFSYGARTAPMLANAEMGLANAMSERDKLLLVLQAAQHEAEHNLEVTHAELKIVETQNQLAQENLRLAKKAFALGESDLVALMRIQALAQEAERNLRNRQTQLQWDAARYNQAVGVLP
ncbi:MAG: TolC family protein [Methylophilaceae bacterium]|nr:TolC family protein [Methylophilaceae bacterium]